MSGETKLPSQWTREDVQKWLKTLDLPEDVHSKMKNSPLDGAKLLTLTLNEVIAFGLNFGPAKKFLLKVAQLKKDAGVDSTDQSDGSKGNLSILEALKQSTDSQTSKMHSADDVVNRGSSDQDSGSAILDVTSTCSDMGASMGASLGESENEGRSKAHTDSSSHQRRLSHHEDHQSVDSKRSSLKKTTSQLLHNIRSGTHKHSTSSDGEHGSPSLNKRSSRKLPAMGSKEKHRTSRDSAEEDGSAERLNELVILVARMGVELQTKIDGMRDETTALRAAGASEANNDRVAALHAKVVALMKLMEPFRHTNMDFNYDVPDRARDPQSFFEQVSALAAIGADHLSRCVPRFIQSSSRANSIKKAEAFVSFANNMHQFFDTGKVETYEVPSVLRAHLGLDRGRKASFSSFDGFQDTKGQDNDESVYRMGELRQYFGGGGGIKGLVSKSGWKTRFCTLDSLKLQFYESEDKTAEPVECIPLRDICSMSSEQKKYKNRSSVFLMETTTSRLEFSLDSAEDMAHWMLSIDNIEKQRLRARLSPMEKLRQLKLVYVSPFKGGVIKSSYEEEWSYQGSGTLRTSEGVGMDLTFVWDGEQLRPPKGTDQSLGTGKWNGVWLSWHAPDGKEFIRYKWEPALNEYKCTETDDKNFQWTRHFLASKYHKGEWIMEGSVPYPVVMFLQCIRFFRGYGLED
mmetsp:Transcript_45740/g.115121  ORF Transcript_45740/g.115121 Transcript_45740/m.115121 type:complete len:687 (+) Transcript_45740:203-2263(+)